ncbi:ECF transporter S component [Ethanoligenens harbinense]|uniref:Riboflavin transporter n=1 Tax=Ethanoligenens harbinense (strain DSM 18485 / JCM 12961 / CGMCC 1.5033 / YUAN-3) TaxID=663278 RepID=E6U5G8_ETHHY|nr:ECF transporter S component [Ethanoligenens harbinense]ADU25635.1 hypothetical protein Ethha_0044 [Ethanoligenens harbinense YUAN-3]AVQ94811.1 ECF transporter S component [Ethanoligenens harbinense YUAN-3]AYF37501.1 ECF transporter S component [Ethanoligenens harbinense]AYF40221.1 ECF transporter S component [Ethanoligenens harbinense]QCN91057.1 ECF transporter S component [Ethanoligenens harbinense]
MYTRQQKTLRMIILGLLAAISIVLYYYEVPFFSNYLKLDFSDLPAAVAAILFGPLAGIVVELIKNLIFFLTRDIGVTMGYGSLINFIVGTALVVPLSLVVRAWIHRGHKWLTAILLGGIAGLASMVAVGVVANYLIAPPFFLHVLHIPLGGTALWAAIGSATILNLVKPVLTAAVLIPVMAAVQKNTHALKV